MPTVIHDTGPAIDADALDAFERELGASLPDDYRAHLLRYNGGRPEPAHFDVVWPSHADPAVRRWQIGGVHYFFPYEGSAEQVDLIRSASAYRDIVPSDTLMIATDQGANPILLGLAGPNRGRVFFQLPGFGEEDQSGPANAWDNVAEVAPSFAAFLDGLRE